MESQSVRFFLCVLASAAAGAGSGFFSCLLSLAEKQKQSNSGRHTKMSKFFSLVGAVGSILFGFGTLAGLAFGPIMLVTVVRSGVTLPANAAFALLMDLRPLASQDYFGTWFCVCGIVSVVSSIAEPPPLDLETYLERVSTRSALAWNAALLALVVLSALACRSMRCTDSPGGPCGTRLCKPLAFGTMVACANGIMDVAGKGWLAVLRSGGNLAGSFVFWLCVAINVAGLVVLRVGTIFACKKTDVLVFMPLRTVLMVLVGVSTGMVVLQESNHITSPVNFVSSALSTLGGILMLVNGPVGAGHRAGGS